MDTPRKKKEDGLPEPQSQNILRFYGLVLLPWFLSGCSGIIIVSMAAPVLYAVITNAHMPFTVSGLVAVVLFVLWTTFIGSWLERRIMPQNLSENRGSTAPDNASMNTLAPHAQYALGADGELIELTDENTPHIN
jgi:hypothetical protein